MDCVFGLVGDGFALIVSDTSAAAGHSILVNKSEEDKVVILDSHKLISASGEAVYRSQFLEYIKKNLNIYKSTNTISLTTASVASYTRQDLSLELRKNPHFINILLAGYEKDIGPCMYLIDYMANLLEIEKGAVGYASFFSLITLDRHYHKGMTLNEAVELVDMCIMEIQTRLVGAPPNFVIKIVDKDGAREYALPEKINDAGAAPANFPV